MAPVAPGPDAPSPIDVNWHQAWRIIASRYPPIDLLERLSSDPAVWDALTELEQATNPRLRDQAGDISLVPTERRVFGPNASWVMAPFTYINPKGSRFADGTFGAYYAARELATAVAETGYHFARFAADSHDPPRREDMRVLLGTITTALDDAGALAEPQRSAVLSKTSYAESQRFAVERRDAGSNGIHYPSVRHDGGFCIAAFWPNVVGLPVQERHLQYEWDGARFTRYFDYMQDVWVNV